MSTSLLNSFSYATRRAAPPVRSGCLIRTNVASRKRPHSSILIYTCIPSGRSSGRDWLDGEGITETGQSSRQRIALFSVRIEFWRSTTQAASHVGRRYFFAEPGVNFLNIFSTPFFESRAE